MNVAEVVLAAIVAAPLSSAVLIWLTRNWLTERLRGSIQHEYNTKLEALKSQLSEQLSTRLEAAKTELRARELVTQARWEIKRNACLDALKVVDGWQSNQDWGVDMEPQPAPTIEQARECYNKLVLSCETPTVPEQYLRCLGALPEEVKASETVVLRNVIRRELGFGEALLQEHDVAWIARLNPPAT